MTGTIVVWSPDKGWISDGPKAEVKIINGRIRFEIIEEKDEAASR